ncbi:protein SHORT HYPOCOTYL IN WHITE LIGHT 1 [Vicia villosa]|uniref:protein SHORT HYPOCOTYL IN WHITE LIGHT 1 n=1 Tax=Vicia villosa TaxID=3911 RepID=UPI00273ABF8F|nr:protein SHORT HYPOCOTYL IN WHITE LIGHT 1 [Vicia villosa]
MAATTSTATTTTQLINLTRSRRSTLRHFSPNNVHILHHQPFTPTLIHNRRSNLTIINCNSKLNNSSGGGEPYEMDGVFGRYDGIEDDSDEDDDAESSVDLLIKFLQSMFKKMSKKAKKACRSVLPSVFSPQLVSFAVDGTLLLASLSVVKALLEVICNIGGTVFAAILILRVILAAVSYFQSSGNSFNQGDNSFGAIA